MHGNTKLVQVEMDGDREEAGILKVLQYVRKEIVAPRLSGFGDHAVVVLRRNAVLLIC